LEHSATLNNYATKTRYGADLVTAKHKLLLLKANATKYMEDVKKKDSD